MFSPLLVLSITKHLRPHLFAYIQKKRLIDQVQGKITSYSNYLPLIAREKHVYNRV